MTTAAKGLRSGCALLVVFLLGACTMVGGGGQGPSPEETGPIGAPPDVPSESLRSYGGSVTFDGSRIALTLELVGSGDEFSARMSIPSLDLDAGGVGTVQGEVLSVELSYTGECPGRLHLTGRLADGARRVEGTLLAADCTGEEEGTVVLLIRPAG